MVKNIPDVFLTTYVLYFNLWPEVNLDADKFLIKCVLHLTLWAPAASNFVPDKIL